MLSGRGLYHQSDSQVFISRPNCSMIILLTVLLLNVVERDGSAVESRTRNRENPGSNPLWYRFEVWAFHSLHNAPVHPAVSHLTHCR